MNGYRRPHPLYVLTNLRRFLWLLIVPLGRGFIAALRGGSVAVYFKGSVLDIAVLLLMVTISLIDWHSFRYRATEEGVDFRRGIFRKRRAFIPVVSTYTVEQPLSYRLVGAARIWADTPAGHYRRADFRVIAYKQDAFELIGRPTERGHRPTAAEVAVMSFLASNSLAGILILVATVRGLGQIAGNAFQRMIFERISKLPALLAFGVPPAAAAVGYLFLAGWVLAFFYNFLRFWGFRAARQGEDLIVSTGLTFRQSQRIAAHAVSYLDIRRNLPGVLLRLYTVLVMAPGLDGKPSVIVPAAGEAATGQLVSRLLPRLRPDAIQMRPAKNSWVRYYSEPLVHMLYIVAAALILVRFFPGWRNVIVYLAAMAEMVPIWGLGIRVADLRAAGAAKAAHKLTLHYSTYFYVHTAVISMDSIASIRIRQTPLQRFAGSCDVIVRSCAEQRNTNHRLRNYRLAEAVRFFDL